MSAGQQGARTRRGKAERKSAEEAIAQATAEALERAANPQPKRSRRKKGDGWPVTAEQLIHERDEKALPWAQVAVNLGLGSTNQARRAYRELTGLDTGDSHPVGVQRARRGSGGSGRIQHRIAWDDESDQEEMIDLVNGPWVPESGSGKDWSPAHWRGSTLIIRRSWIKEPEGEVVNAKFVLRMTFGPNGDQPLQIEVVDRETGGTRSFYVADIMEVQ